MNQPSPNEKESRPCSAAGSKVTNTNKVSTNNSRVAGENRQELLRDIEEVTRTLSRYSFIRLRQPVLRHPVYGLLPIRTITESMEYASTHPDEDTPGSGRARWGYLKENSEPKTRSVKY